MAEARIEATCPDCEKSFHVRPAERGKVTGCPRCGAWVDVPELGCSPTSAEVEEAARRDAREDERQLADIAAGLGVPVAAVALVDSVTGLMAWHAANAGMAEVPDVGAAGFCRLLRARVREEFGSSGAAVLRGWGLARSEDIGRIVFALVAAGRLEAGAEDSEADFAGLFAVDDYFA